MTDDGQGGLGRLVRLAVVGGVALAIAVAIFIAMRSQTGVRRQVAPETTIAIMPQLPPPPPPPPPPKEQPPEPEKLEQPKPAEPQNDQPRQMTINGPAQAGTDAFGIGAGSGGGNLLGGSPTGPDIGNSDFAKAAYTRYLKSELQSAVDGDSRVNRSVFSVEVNVWVENGRRRAQLLQSSGDPKIDKALIEDIERTALDAPPSGVKLPARIRIRGRRSV